MFTINEARLLDYTVVEKFKYQLYSAMADIMPTIHKTPDPQTPFFSEKAFQEDLSEKVQAYFIARIGSTNEPIGFISVGRRSSPNTPMFTKSSFANIDEIYVVPQHRKDGVGRALVKAAYLWAEENELRTVKTGVYTLNEEGDKFWEKMGFKPYKTLMERLLP